MRRSGTGFLVNVGTANVASAGRFDIDLRDGKLGWLEVEARADGKPVAAASIVILRKAPRVGAADTWESERAIADADGRARFGPLPAEALSLAILTFDDHWAYARPQPVEVVPGTTTTIAIDVPFVRGSIRIRGSDGAWLAATPVTCIFPVTPWWVSRPGTTGADGTLELGPAGAAAHSWQVGERLPRVDRLRPIARIPPTQEMTQRSARTSPLDPAAPPESEWSPFPGPEFPCVDPTF